MTQNRRLKKRVRDRVAKTGESYSTALRHLRGTLEKQRMNASQFQTFTNHDFGYSLAVPDDWRSVGPVLQNSVYEVGRYLRNTDHLHSGGALVFWGESGDSAMALAEQAAEEWVPYGGRDMWNG